MANEGKVWKFGDNISTDLMMPGMSRRGRVPDNEVKRYCMYAICPQFGIEAKPGDIVVAGKNCGCGSSRLAAQNFKELGIGCIIAESFNATFFRNSISIGFPVFEVNDVSSFFDDGDVVELDIDKYTVRNVTKNTSITVEPYPDVLKKVFDAGGVKQLLKQELTPDE